MYLSNTKNDPDLILAGDFNDALLTDHEGFDLLDEQSGLRILTADAPCKICTPQSHTYTDPIDHIIVSKDAAKSYDGTTVFDNYFADTNLPDRETYSDHCVLWSSFSATDQDPTGESTQTAG